MDGHINLLFSPPPLPRGGYLGSTLHDPTQNWRFVLNTYRYDHPNISVTILLYSPPTLARLICLSANFLKMDVLARDRWH